MSCANRWRLFLRFHPIAYVPIDHEVADHSVATRPASFFRSAVVTVRVAETFGIAGPDDVSAFLRIVTARSVRAVLSEPGLARISGNR